MTKKKMVLTISLVVLVAAAILAVALVITFNANGVALATQELNSGKTTGQVPVTYSVDDTWTVTIPDSIEIGEEGTGTGSVEASDVKIEQGKNLNVTVDSENNWKLKGGENKELSYQLKADGEPFAQQTGNEVLSVAAGTDSDSAELTATVTDTNYSTGGSSYSDTLTFNVAVA